MLDKNGRFSGVRTLIFDLDGTLIDSKLDLVLSVNAMLEHMGREPHVHEKICSFVGSGAPTLVRRALGDEVTETEVEKGLAYFFDYYRAHMLDNTVPLSRASAKGSRCCRNIRWRCSPTSLCISAAGLSKAWIFRAISVSFTAATVSKRRSPIPMARTFCCAICKLRRTKP